MDIAVRWPKSPHRYWNSRAIWDKCYLPAGRGKFQPLPQLKLVLGLATPEGCKAKLTGDEIANVNFFMTTSSTTFTQCTQEATEFDEITQNKGHYTVQGHQFCYIIQ